MFDLHLTVCRFERGKLVYHKNEQIWLQETPEPLALSARKQIQQSNK